MKERNCDKGINDFKTSCMIKLITLLLLQPDIASKLSSNPNFKKKKLRFIKIFVNNKLWNWRTPKISVDESWNSTNGPFYENKLEFFSGNNNYFFFYYLAALDAKLIFNIFEIHKN